MKSTESDLNERTLVNDPLETEKEHRIRLSFISDGNSELDSEYDAKHPIFTESGYFKSHESFHNWTLNIKNETIAINFSKSVFDTFMKLMDNNLDEIMDMEPLMMHQIMRMGEMFVFPDTD